MLPCILNLGTRKRPGLNFRPLRLCLQVNLSTLSKILFHRLGELQGQSGRYERDMIILSLLFQPVANYLCALTQVSDGANAGTAS
jgi:hypothetical protein